MGTVACRACCRLRIGIWRFWKIFRTARGIDRRFSPWISRNRQEKKITALDGASGHYLSFAATGLDSPLSDEAVRDCPSDLPTLGSPLGYIDLIHDGNSDKLHLLTDDGKLLALPGQAASACETQRDEMFFELEGNPTSINILSDQSLGITTVTDHFVVVKFDNAAYTISSRIPLTQCQVTFGATRFASGAYGLGCFGDGKMLAPYQFEAEDFRILTIDDIGNPLSLVPITLGPQGPSVDLTTAKLFELSASALGNLTVTELLTGRRRLKKGLFVEGIFD
jgi:hypothetical protein